MDSDAHAGLDDISTECSRIGFDLRDLAGLAFSDEDALLSFLNLLREVPSGVGLEGFLQRMSRHGYDLRTTPEE